MVSNQDWAQALDVDPQKLEELQRSCPPDMPLIALVLEHGLVGENTYLNWAREKYALPSLKNEFFSSGKALTEITTPGGLEPWNPHFVPVYQWEGTLFVGCLEPQFLPAEGFQLVLCGAESLRQHYDMLANGAGATAPPPPLEEAIAAPAVSSSEEPAAAAPPDEAPAASEGTPSLDFNMGDIPSLENVEVDTSNEPKASAVEDTPPPTTMATEEASTTPDEDFSSPDSFDLDFSSLGTTTDIGQSDVPAAAPSTNATPPPPPTVDDIPLEAGEALAAPELNFEISEDPLSAPATDDVLSAPAAPPAPSPAEDILTAPPAEDILAAPPAPAAPEPPPPPPEEPTSKTITGTMTETPGNENIDAWSEGLFDQMDKYFDGKMIITKLDEGFAPRFWTGHWQPKSKNSPFININDSNIFKIAHRTKRPFHGNISPNEVNDAFFEFWNSQNYPHEITIQPIVKDSEVIGMIVGVPRNEDQRFKKLRLIETVSGNAANQMAQPAA